MNTQKNLQVVYKRVPDGEAKLETFDYVETTYPTSPPQKDHVIVKNIYMSLDPVQRMQMTPTTCPTFLKPWVVGERITGLAGVGQVVETNSSDYSKGDYIIGTSGWPWSNYFVANVGDAANGYQKFDKEIASKDLTIALSLMGLVGLTTISGLSNLGNITKDGGQTLVVSGAAGACGSLAGQIGRLLGCARAVGICGSDAKCEWITKTLGFDKAINYKTQNVPEELRKACPRGVDVYFDNVGGKVSEEIIKLMNKNSSCIVCGQIAAYNDDVEPGPLPLPAELNEKIKKDNILRKWFTIFDYLDQLDKLQKMLLNWYFENKIKVKVTVEEGLENTGRAFLSLMTGGNTGKQLVKAA